MSMNITYISIYKTSLPVLVSLLMEYLIGFTDTAYLGRVGETELAASAIAGTYYMIIYMIGFGFSIGAQILIAQYNGNQQYKETGKFSHKAYCFADNRSNSNIAFFYNFTNYIKIDYRF